MVLTAPLAAACDDALAKPSKMAKARNGVLVAGVVYLLLSFMPVHPPQSAACVTSAGAPACWDAMVRCTRAITTTVLNLNVNNYGHHSTPIAFDRLEDSSALVKHHLMLR